MLAGITLNGWPRKEHIVIVVSNRIYVTKGQGKKFAKRFQAREGLVEKMPGFIRKVAAALPRTFQPASSNTDCNARV